MKINQVNDGTYLAVGEGYDRPIIAEGGTWKEAEFGFNEAYGDQYARAQVADRLSEFGVVAAIEDKT